ncbi:MAG: hypothetical protein ACOYOQ_00395 [Microthrixaceae bacterium]
MDTITVNATGANDITIVVTFHTYDLRVTLHADTTAVGLDRAGVNPTPVAADGDTINGLIATAKVNTHLLAQSLTEVASR